MPNDNRDSRLRQRDTLASASRDASHSRRRHDSSLFHACYLLFANVLTYVISSTLISLLAAAREQGQLTSIELPPKIAKLVTFAADYEQHTLWAIPLFISLAYTLQRVILQYVSPLFAVTLLQVPYTVVRQELVEARFVLLSWLLFRVILSESLRNSVFWEYAKYTDLARQRQQQMRQQQSARPQPEVEPSLRGGEVHKQSEQGGQGGVQRSELRPPTPSPLQQQPPPPPPPASVGSAAAADQRLDGARDGRTQEELQQQQERTPPPTLLTNEERFERLRWLRTLRRQERGVRPDLWCRITAERSNGATNTSNTSHGGNGIRNGLCSNTNAPQHVDQ